MDEPTVKDLIYVSAWLAASVVLIGCNLLIVALVLHASGTVDLSWIFNR